MKSTSIKPVMVSLFWTGVLSLSLGLTACSENSERIVNTAPTASEDLGHIVFGATESEKQIFFDTHTQTKLRDISNDKDYPIFEVINADTTTLRKNFPTARFIKNEFIPFADVKQQPLTLNQIKNLDFELSSTSDAFDLNSCRDDSLKPIAKMTPVSQNLLTRRPLEIGAEIKIVSSQSQPHAFVGGPIKKAWIIQAPIGSNVPEMTFSDELNIELDTMGMYQVYLLVQDQKRNCQFETVNISVTGNAPFIGVSASSLDVNISGQPYLQKLGLAKAHQTTKGEGVLIAVVDSGVNYNHPYLAENIFINPNEIAGNGIDDDGNGLIDDVHGWDFVYNDQYPYDDLGHGSHVAGLAAAKVFGIAPNAKILPIKAGNNSGMLDLGTTFKSVIYAIRMNADIINLSLGGERPAFREELELYKQALDNNVLIVAAAGNGEPSRFGIFLGVDIDNKSYSPAGIDLENILSVASLSNNDNLAYYSNFGRRKINVATYGGEDFDITTNRPYEGQLFSTYIENAKGELFFAAQGTSMAAPVASGIAALVRSTNPNLTPGQTTRLLENAGPETRSLRGKVKSGRILTADDAVEQALSTIQLLN